MREPRKGERVVVIPLKSGMWRVACMTPARHERWKKAWHKWFEGKGQRLAISPEMWVEK